MEELESELLSLELTLSKNGQARTLEFDNCSIPYNDCQKDKPSYGYDNSSAQGLEPVPGL